MYVYIRVWDAYLAHLHTHAEMAYSVCMVMCLDVQDIVIRTSTPTDKKSDTIITALTMTWLLPCRMSYAIMVILFYSASRLRRVMPLYVLTVATTTSTIRAAELLI